MLSQKYKNPPITEAIMDIRVELDSSVTPEMLKPFHDSIVGKFPKIEEVRQFEGGFEFSKNFALSGMQQKNTHLGYSCKTMDGSKVVQVSTEGFTFNKLKPYEGWDALKPEALELWNKYYDLVKPKRITRIALRYINRIELPQMTSDLGEYVRTQPSISSDLPHKLHGFFMRLLLEDPLTSSQAFLIQLIDPASEKEIRPPLIIDIDAFKIVDLKENSDSIWEVFSRLRKFKNSIFENSFTPKGLDLFS